MATAGDTLSVINIMQLAGIGDAWSSGSIPHVTHNILLALTLADAVRELQ